MTRRAGRDGTARRYPRRRLHLGLLAAGLVAGVWFAAESSGQTPPPLPGIVELSMSTVVRPQPTAAEIAAFVPTSRAPFLFPAPYGTQGYRLTEGSDCGGQDCVAPVGYAYWRNINHHPGFDKLYLFLSLRRQQGGAGPTLFSIDKPTGQVSRLGPLFAPDDPRSWSSGEGWYFSATSPNMLYVHGGADPALVRYDVWSRQSSTVLDLSTQTALYGANPYVWQPHSSNDDLVHSFTVRRNDGSAYPMLGCGVYLEGPRQFRFFPLVSGADGYDECQVDKSGRWLVIKEQVDQRNGHDNRVIDLQTGRETVLLDERGAGGHSDVGFGYLVATDNWFASPAIRLWQLGADPLGPGTVVYREPSWSSESIVHVSHQNARPGDSGQQYACGSGASRTAGPRVGEISCFLLDGSLQTLVVAPVMTDLNAAGGGATDDYARLPKGNLDTTGEYFIWTANLGTGRLDAFVVRIPQTDAFAPRTTTAPSPPTSVRIIVE